MPFVGREHEQQIYRDFLTHESPWVFIINGLGGSGKSSLLNRLKEYTVNTFSQTGGHSAQRMIVVKIDFATYGQQADYLSILGEFISLGKFLMMGVVLLKSIAHKQNKILFARKSLYIAERLKVRNLELNLIRLYKK